ncbi:DNA cytosine methyltransferase [Alcaligenes faecalis]|uniref:DNA cytosine methyltransferase n=1 Tax=Alcaligenes faecalis TaxID=511 RepID=UPI001C83BF26|nr:DNA (cytosine-5-)-methyltransferase [Alcaligenes faecalis]MBX6964223.1 DNA (cytosine-5-)-methyltransferase [Providencia rettgeri]MBX7029400.1 DNA (cytosine-5-)-methyltransferase [Alcaligenes faecalis]
MKKTFERAGEEIRVLSLFSGCGGMDFGVETAGGHVIFSNDILVDACKTLKKYFPNTDIRNADISDIQTFPDADIVVGGYPCQSFSMAGNRDPKKDERTNLYKQFLRVIGIVHPNYFVAENVSGLKALSSGTFLKEQLEAYDKAGYNVTYKLLNAKDYGVPQSRKRLFIVGVRKDLNQVFEFPKETHGKTTKASGLLLPYASHGDAIKGLPLWPEGEFYERPDKEGNFSWYYMSRNRKAKWADPAFTVVANWRHITLHPASPVMTLTWSNLADGWKQRWDFSDQYEHLEANPKHKKLETPRRLSWRECALIQTFDAKFNPVGDTESKFTQIGNAVPPRLAEAIFSHLFSGAGLVSLGVPAVRKIA